MKTTKLIVTLATLAFFPGFAPAVKTQPSQDQPPLPGPAGPIPDGEQTRRSIEQARRDIEQSRRQMELAQKMSLGREGDDGKQFDRQKMALISSEDRLKNFTYRLNGPLERSLVIASSEIAPDVLAELNEDLTVMAKLIDDAVAGDRGDVVTRRAMGIAVNLNLSFAGGGNDARRLYVENYGAIFEIPVPFPLAPSANGKSDPQPRPAKSSAWDAARHELYAQPGDEGDLADGSDTHNAYSAERVDSLKQSILKALANAGNFRHLKANEKITVVVLSRGEPKRWTPDLLPGFPGKPPASQPKPSAATLTISIKKSDADELAAGKINEDTFRKRAAIALY